MRKPRQKHRKKNLIVLVYGMNTAYTLLQTEVPKEVEIDTREGTWTYGHLTFRIGESCTSFYAYGGVPVGVYDRTKLSHLRNVLEASSQLARGPSRSID